MRSILTRPLWIWPAIFASGIGVAFMLGVGIITALRYGIDLQFDPEHNEHIATFIAGIAGTLFSLANAALLFAALEAQRHANELTKTHHQQDAQDRNYDRLSSRVQEIENRILNYQVTIVDLAEDGKHLKSEMKGYDAWEQAFQYWVNGSFPTSVWASLKLDSDIDPEAYLHDQTFMLDTLVHLNYVIEDIDRSSLGQRDMDFLLRRAKRLRNRLARHKDRIRTARDFLRKTIGEGIEGVPKRDYVSPLLHVIKQMDEALALLPDVPYRTLSPFDKVTIQLDAATPSIVMVGLEVPTLQIDRVHFSTIEKHWSSRLAPLAVKVEMEAVSNTAQQLYYESRLLSIGSLLFEGTSGKPDFDTKGRWSMDGRYNEWAGPPESHAKWRIRISVPDLNYAFQEAMSVTLYTNAAVNQAEAFIGIRGDEQSS